MTGLIVAEAKRLVWRRLTWVIAAGLLLIGLAVAGVAALNLSMMQPTTTMRPQEMAAMLRSGFEATAIVTSLATFLLGATFVGAEFSSGSLSQWLTFSPNRHRVLGAKLLVIALGGLVITAAALAGFYLMVLLFAAGYHFPTPQLGGAFGIVGRGIVLGAMASVGGAALAALFGHTAAGPVTLGAYVIVMIIRSMFGMLSNSMLRWSPEIHIHGFISGSFNLPLWDPVTYESYQVPIPLAESALYVTALLAVVVALAWWRFVRRDHT